MPAARILTALLGLLLLAWPAQAAQTVVISVAVKPGVGQAVAAEKFKELVESRAKGRMQVQVAHEDAGGSETRILERLKDGRIQLAVTSAGPLDQWAPEVKVVEYPFLFRDHAQADRVLDGRPGQTVLKALEKAGFKGLAFAENGFRHLTNNLRPVRKAADVQGLRVRVMESALHTRLWATLGATPVPHAWPIGDLLAKGAVDGQENPLQIMWAYRLDRQQKHLSLTGHSYSVPVCLANLAWFNGLKAPERKLVAQAMRDAAAHQRLHTRAVEARSLAELKKAGMLVVENPDRASLAKKAQALSGDPQFSDPAVAEMLKLFQRAAR